MYYINCFLLAALLLSICTRTEQFANEQDWTAKSTKPWEMLPVFDWLGINLYIDGGSQSWSSSRWAPADVTGYEGTWKLCVHTMGSCKWKGRVQFVKHAQTSLYLGIMVWHVLEEKEIEALACCYRVSHWSSLWRRIMLSLRIKIPYSNAI